jgi:hypothetical protein
MKGQLQLLVKPYQLKSITTLNQQKPIKIITKYKNLLPPKKSILSVDIEPNLGLRHRDSNIIVCKKPVAVNFKLFSF